MPYAVTDDGVKLYAEEVGEGTPVIFVHEFAGDYRSWEPQMRWFSRRYRCIAYNARGFPPSEVPDGAEAYSQARAARDIRDVLDHFGIERAHIVGLSMGGSATLQFGLDFPERALSLVAAGAGLGSDRDRTAVVREAALEAARAFEAQGAQAYSATYAMGPTRIAYLVKDPRGWEEFRALFAEHSAEGSARTLRGVQARRASLYDLEDGFRRMSVPTLIMVGDEDDPCLQPALFLKRTIPASGLVVLPKSGHAVNTEEPDLFNRFVGDFLAQADAGRWAPRDPRSDPEGIFKTR